PVSVAVNCPRLSITKSASAESVSPGDSFTYTITVTNISDFVARDVVIDDEVPTGLTIDSVDGPNCTVNGQHVSCAAGNLDPGSSVTVTIHVTATEAACPSVTNTAHVTFTEGETSGSADSNPVTVDVQCQPNIGIIK